MNILHIVYAKVWGGGEQYVYNFCREEKRLGHKNMVVFDAAQKQVLGRLQDVADVKYAPLRGVPVISTDSGAQGEIIQNGKSGFLVPAQNAQMLAEKLLYLARHPQEYANMARQAHERVQANFTLSVMIEKINKLFAELLNK